MSIDDVFKTLGITTENAKQRYEQLRPHAYGKEIIVGENIKAHIDTSKKDPNAIMVRVTYETGKKVAVYQVTPKGKSEPNTLFMKAHNPYF